MVRHQIGDSTVKPFIYICQCGHGSRTAREALIHQHEKHGTKA